MASDDAALVQESFAEVRALGDAVPELFYARLFEIAPEVRPMFQGDMAEQGRKLMGTLSAVVNGLHDLPGVLPAAEALARRHIGYGVRPEHYGKVGEALLWTLEQGLGPAFKPEVQAAWTGAYETLSSAMIAAAYPPGVRAA